MFSAALTGAGVVLALIPGNAQPVGYVLAPLCALLTWRLSTAGAHVDATGVKVVGPLLSRRIEWGEIDCFEDRSFQRYPHAAHIILRNGQEVLIPGLDIGRFEGERGRRKVQTKVDELNQELANWRTGGPGFGAEGGQVVQLRPGKEEVT